MSIHSKAEGLGGNLSVDEISVIQGKLLEDLPRKSFHLRLVSGNVGKEPAAMVLDLQNGNIQISRGLTLRGQIAIKALWVGVGGRKRGYSMTAVGLHFAHPLFSTYL